MIDLISFCVLVAIALVLGRTTGKKAGAGITQMFVKGRPVLQTTLQREWNGVVKLTPTRKLTVEDTTYPVFRGTVSPRAIRNYLKREKLPAVIITAKQVS